MRLNLEERDLSLVIFLVVEKAVPFDPATGDAFDFLNLDDGVFSRRLTVVAVVVMVRRNVEVKNLHTTDYV